MNLRDLRYVLALADNGHFRKAAESVFVSQSTLSIQIKHLETQLGVTIFDRSVSPVRATARGQVIVDSARRILAEADQLRQWARGETDLMATTLRIGIIPTLAPYYLPHAMRVLQNQFPQLKIILLELQTPDILSRLQQGTIDGGILAVPVGDTAGVLEEIPLFREPFVAVLPSSINLSSINASPINPTAKKSSKSLSSPLKNKSPVVAATKSKKTQDLVINGLKNPPQNAIGLTQFLRDEANLSLLLLEEGHCLRGQALSACQMSDPVSEPVRATSLETLRQMVAQGLGWTLMPLLATPFTESGALWADKRLFYQRLIPPISRTIGMVYRAKSPLVATLQQLAKSWRSPLPEGTEKI